MDQYQNAISRAILLHELKKVQLQERFMVMTHASHGHLKMLCLSVLVLSLIGNATTHHSKLGKK